MIHKKSKGPLFLSKRVPQGSPLSVKKGPLGSPIGDFWGPLNNSIPCITHQTALTQYISYQQCFLIEIEGVHVNTNLR